ncbi:MAG: rare lipoprotein, partial [Phenylobacterium sp.]|nr:rare lipoprotein [Phenylobacterium sp.]
MDRGHIVRTGRLAVMLLGSATLTACMTPQYAARGPVGYAPEVPAKAPPAPRGRYKTGDPYQVGGIWYVPHEQPNYDQTGVASWYGDAFQMKATANGEIFDMNQFSAAHTTLPLPSMVEVTNLDNGRKLTVRVNDRGPFVGARIIDLSHAAARELGYERQGTARVRVRYVGPAPLGGPEAGVRIARATAPAYVPAKAVRPADEEIFAAATPAATAPIGTAPRRGLQVELKPLVAPPEPVSVSTLSPLARFARSDALAAETGVYRIQAGAFADRAHARRAADQLSAQGVATV